MAEHIFKRINGLADVKGTIVDAKGNWFTVKLTGEPTTIKINKNQVHEFRELK